MSKPKILLTDAYQIRLGEIEDFVWESSGRSIQALEAFLEAHDQALAFLIENPTTPARHHQTGDQSWPFSDGRYRLFFKYDSRNILLLDLIDNRMSNLNIYPNNKLPTYNED